MVNGANPFKLYVLNGSGRLTDALDGEGATRLAKAIMNAKAEASHKSCTHTTIGGFPFLRDCDAKRRVPHASPRGLRAPAAPAPPFFGSPKKGGKESSPLAMSPGLLPATRYARPAQMPAHGRRGSRAHRPTPKSPAARRHPPGAKKRHTGHPHKKRPP